MKSLFLKIKKETTLNIINVKTHWEVYNLKETKHNKRLIKIQVDSRELLFDLGLLKFLPWN